MVLKTYRPVFVKKLALNEACTCNENMKTE